VEQSSRHNRRQEELPTFCGRKDFRVTNITSVRALGFPHEGAIDTWESEGGSLVINERAYDLEPPTLADNVDWRASHKRSWAVNDPERDTSALPRADEDDDILRHLGAAVIMRWNTIPRKLQKELFDNASSMGELPQADALKGQIARFLHKHKDDVG
jgi:hypothetical protein